MTAPKEIIELVNKFERNIEAYKNSSYNEEQVKQEFINPFFEALGWDVNNKSGAAPQYKDVIFEDSIKVGSGTKAPDYCFTLAGRRIFFVEAKKPFINIESDIKPSYQLRRYAWSAKLDLSILTDFEELAVYESKTRPLVKDRASVGRILFYSFKDYIEKWDEIYSIFSKDAVLKGSFDKFAKKDKGKKGTSEVDAEFLKEIDSWRLVLARNIALRNPDITVKELNYTVQQTIDRIIFLRMAEDRGIERYGRLKELTTKDNIYKEFGKLCIKADAKYNSGLFHFKEEKEISLPADKLTLGLNIDDGVFKTIFKNLYYPNSPYEFSVLSPEILGNVYEQFLGKVIRLTKGHQAKVEEKAEVKKAGGVFYTPQYIVDYIVENTVGKLCETPKQVSKLRIVDPACGSGSFLLGAYKYLLNWHRDYYSNEVKVDNSKIYQGKNGNWYLTIKEKKRILLNNIYGVDIDSQAVEVTKLSLLLKVLEDENKDALESQQKLFQERVLPFLGDNIRCGNSLIGSDIFDEDLSSEEIVDINPFDWADEFKEVFDNGGFDAVIGNPPYVNIINIDKKVRPYFKEKYESAKYGRIDLYLLFMDKSINLLKEGGFNSFIIPDKFCIHKYGTILRKIILDKCTINEILDLRNIKVFKKATVDNIVYIIKNQISSKNKVLIKKVDKGGQCLGDFNYEKNYLQQDLFLEIPEHMFRLDLTYEKWKIIKKIDEKSIKMSDICYISFGLQPGKLSKFVFNKDKNPERMSENVDSIKKFIRGRNIKRYKINYSNDLVFYLPDKLHRPAFPELFENPKICISEISSDIKGCFDDEKFYGNEKTVQMIMLHLFENIGDSVIKRRSININDEIITYSKKFDLKYVLAILNSTLLNFYFKTMLSDGLNAFPDNIRSLPIIFTNVRIQNLFVTLVEKMIQLNKDLANVKTPHEKKLLEKQILAIDKKIDKMVYELYGLNKDEINLIKNN
ncbi:MAG: Eco57I restriction-modification methylase domain-containing protein [Methanobacteriaceae archaeon]